MQEIFACGIQNLGKFACGIRNPEFWNPEYSSRNPESNFHWQRLESSHWNLESMVWNPESRIEDRLGFPNMGQILSAISAVMASMLNKNLGLKTRLSEKEKKHYFPFVFGCVIGPSSCMLPSARPMSFSFAESTVLRLQVNCKRFSSLLWMTSVYLLLILG